MGRGPASGSTIEDVRAWRVPEYDRVLFMHGTTTQYSVVPRGEYVIGVAHQRSFKAARGRRTHVVRPGQLVVWDPSDGHEGSSFERSPWEARLMLIELPDLNALATDPETRTVELEFPDPVVDNRELASRFVRLHRAMDGPASSLERESRLSAWLQDLAAQSPPTGRVMQRRTASSDSAVGRALEYLRDNSANNVSLDQLADASGTSKFRLVRLFRVAFGVGPHAFQVSQRVAAARRLLERGVAPVEAALEVGFFDQSHLHRHFQPRLGVTPREYASLFSAAGCLSAGSTRADASPNTHGLVSLMKSVGKPATKSDESSRRRRASGGSVQSIAARLSSS
jgi:AraC-like DNA-binding protein